MARDDDGEEPPLLFDTTEHHDNQQDSHTQPSLSDPHGDKSMMEEMMSIAQKAKQSKQRQRDMERRNTKTFGSGLKKGFFSSSTKTKKTSGTSREILEVRDDMSEKVV